jgi:hypothetical protein
MNLWIGLIKLKLEVVWIKVRATFFCWRRDFTARARQATRKPRATICMIKGHDPHVEVHYYTKTGDWYRGEFCSRCERKL